MPPLGQSLGRQVHTRIHMHMHLHMHTHVRMRRAPAAVGTIPWAAASYTHALHEIRHSSVR